MDLAQAPPAEPPPVDPRLEADLADLLRPERPNWMIRLASAAAVPAAITLLAALLAIPLLRTDLPVGAPSAAPPADGEPAVPPVTATPTPPPAPPPPPAPLAPPAPAATAPAVQDDWLAAAEGMAAAFAVDYLTWPQLPEDRRATVLTPYLADGVDPAAGWRTTGPLVAATPIVTDVHRDGPDRVTVTIVIRITGQEASRWVHLAVPIGRDDDDRLAVTDLPRLVLPQPAGDPTPAELTDEPGLRRLTEPAILAAAEDHLDRLGEATGFDATAIRVDTVHRHDHTTAVARLLVELTDTVTDAQLTQALIADLHLDDGTWTVEDLR